ncbi:11538_t:CDS:1 [Ambispora leptoticha]|uniref:11538_t:CDS:1 n=1 Tax=Ambispora leptoticha TaxID=144679 RepID=A0A9N9H224_9GLOM|nr:11538_t:CDS:1 [Ambispora leptoticha]
MADIETLDFSDQTLLADLLSAFRAVKVPGGDDQYLLERIEKWIAAHKIPHQVIFQKLVIHTAKNVEFACLLGIFYHYAIGTPQNPTKAFEMYKLASENNDAFGQNQVGWCYIKAFGTDIDFKLGFEWYQKSAAGGDHCGECGVGYCYRMGCGTEIDIKKSLYWYRKSAFAGECTGEFGLAFFYRDGWGVPKDVHQAIKWYVKAKGCYSFWHLSQVMYP